MFPLLRSCKHRQELRPQECRFAGESRAEPSSLSIRNKRLNLATRSLRQPEPVFKWPAPTATVRSAMVVSSVSPERCEMKQR